MCARTPLACPAPLTNGPVIGWRSPSGCAGTDTTLVCWESGLAALVGEAHGRNYSAWRNSGVQEPGRPRSSPNPLRTPHLS